MTIKRSYLANVDLLRRVVRANAVQCQTDGQLLGRFLDWRDEAAFAALVQRHGPMVLGVCRRVLGHLADAEDAFQATFVVLVRQASRLRSRSVLGDYLHGIARHTALKARTAIARRRARERAAARSEGNSSEIKNDFLPLLDEELSRLPEKYRIPIILCDLEGKTRREAAKELGWPEGTVATRINRGRARLARGLLRDAQALSLGSLASGSLPLVVSNALVKSTVQTATSVATRKAMTLSPGVLTLVQGVLQTMLWNKLKVGVIILLAAITTAGVGGFTYRVASGAGQPGIALAHGGENTPQVGDSKGPERNDPHPVVGDGPGLIQYALPTGNAEAVAKMLQEALPASTTGVRITNSGNNAILVYASPPVQSEIAELLNPLLVRELDLQRFPAKDAVADGRQQTIITDEKQLAQLVRDEGWQRKIARQVNFDTERLLFFAWNGGPGDRLTYTVEEIKAQPVVVFHYALTGTKSTVPHAHLFAISKDAGWKVADDRTPALRLRKIDLQGFPARFPLGSALKPTHIQSLDDLANTIADKQWQAKIAKQVDFTKEQLVLFAWSGSSKDKLSCLQSEGDKGQFTAVFEYLPGETDDLESHLFLIALSKDICWKVEKVDRRQSGASGSADKVEKDITSPPAKPMVGEEGSLKQYALSHARAEDAAKVLQQIYAKSPTVRVTANASSNTVFVLAGPADQDDIARLIQQLDRKSPLTGLPTKDSTTETLIEYLSSKDPSARAAAIDLLGDRKAHGIVPKLVEMTGDNYAIDSTTNYVGLHAIKALQQITGQKHKDQKSWEMWLAKNQEDQSSVKILNTSATVELRGILCTTPKGVFLVVRHDSDQPDVSGTWELDISQHGAAEKAPKELSELSGQTVVVTGTCKLVRGREAKKDSWELERIVQVAKCVPQK